MAIEITPKEVICWGGSLTSLQVVLTAEQDSIGKAFHGDDDEDGERHRLLSVEKGIATVMVHGSLTHVDSYWNRYFGITSYNEIRNAIVEAIEDEDVNKILLDIDSPGGSVKGLGELADFIKSAREHKPISTYISGSAFSAAYWIASVTEKISGPKMSEAGSIGVIAILAEMVKMFKNAGVEIHVFRAGKFKALGNPYEKLSDKGKEIIQGKLDKTEEFFLDAVSENRNIPRDKVKSRVGEGLTFFASDAVANGLMDEVISFDELFGRLVKTSNSSSGGRQVLSEDVEMGRKILTERAIAAKASGASDEEVEALLAEEEIETEAEEETETGAEEETETGAEEETETGAEEETETGAGDDTSLVAYLKGENQTLRDENTELNAKVGNVNTLEANEGILKVIAAEYIANMCIALGVTPMKLSAMDTSAVLAQYDTIRAEYVKQYKAGGHANVQDEDEEEASATSNAAATPLESAAIKANSIK